MLGSSRLFTLANIVIALVAPTVLAAEEKIDADNLPKAVADTLKEKYPNTKVTNAWKITSKDKVTYKVRLETDVTVDNEKQKIQLRLTTEGKIEMQQKQVAVKDLPKALTDKLEKKWPNPKYTRAFEEPYNDKTTYVITFESGDKKIEAWMYADGGILAFGDSRPAGF